MFVSAELNHAWELHSGLEHNRPLYNAADSYSMALAYERELQDRAGKYTAPEYLTYQKKMAQHYRTIYRMLVSGLTEEENRTLFLVLAAYDRAYRH